MSNQTETNTGPSSPSSPSSLDRWVENIMGGFTGEQLEVAFNCVKDIRNWKYPIDASFGPSVTSVTREQVSAAIDFYAGGGAVITDLENGYWSVKAPGYYEMIGS